MTYRNSYNSSNNQPENELQRMLIIFSTGILFGGTCLIIFNTML